MDLSQLSVAQLAHFVSIGHKELSEIPVRLRESVKRALASIPPPPVTPPKPAEVSRPVLTAETAEPEIEKPKKKRKKKDEKREA